MDKVSGRIWIVLVGVAIAALVVVMTFFWNGPVSMKREAARPGIADTKRKQSKMTQEILHYFIKAAPPSTLRTR